MLIVGILGVSDDVHYFFLLGFHLMDNECLKRDIYGWRHGCYLRAVRSHRRERGFHACDYNPPCEEIDCEPRAGSGELVPENMLCGGGDF